MTKHIGIVACSAEGAALCYRTVCVEGAELFGMHGHPEVTMHTHSLADYVTHLDRDDWAGVGELMLASAEKLARVGADFLICPDNTIHAALPHIAGRSPLPFLHIADCVAEEARRRGFGRLGITGTRWLVEGPVYSQKLEARGIASIVPGEAERREVDRIIMAELVCGVFKPESVATLQGVIERLKEAGADAVVLGCTELPIVLSDENSALPTLDSTRLLARAALRRAKGVETAVAAA